MSDVDVSVLATEAASVRSANLDAMSTIDVVSTMNDADQLVAMAVGQASKSIASAVDAIAERLHKGGRLIYIGAGTSGRLGVLDAAECPPTFSADPSRVCGIIAGGERAMTQSVEGAEDDAQLAVDDLVKMQLGAKDAVVGIAASGRTPFAVGGLKHARAVGALSVALTMNANSPIADVADIAIEVLTGPEILTGSTRLKAGTATKMVLNMLSTGTFVRLNKVYGNLMVDVQATNEKLRARSVAIVAQACECDAKRAMGILADADGDVKVAIVAAQKSIAAHVARTLLFTHDGSVRDALDAPV
jgi:N-acetylmuramic acid 6-phosphate etherase